MNRTPFALAALTAAAAISMLGGCATSPPPAQEIDSTYVSYVENAARRYGTTVIWLNYPMRRAEPATAAPAEPAGK
jgi:hypothetical protein